MFSGFPLERWSARGLVVNLVPGWATARPLLRPERGRLGGSGAREAPASVRAHREVRGLGACPRPRRIRYQVLGELPKRPSDAPPPSAAGCWLLVVRPARPMALAGRSSCAGESPCRPGWATMEARMAAYAKRIEVTAADRPVLEVGKLADGRATAGRAGADSALGRRGALRERDRRSGWAAFPRPPGASARAMSARASRGCGIDRGRNGR